MPSLAARAGAEMLGSLLTCCLALGSVANALLPRTKGEGMGLLPIAVAVGLGIGLPISCFWRVSAYFNPGILLAEAVRGHVGGAGPFFALLGAELAGWFVGAVVLYVFYLPHLNAAVALPAADEIDRLLQDPAVLSDVALMNASYTLAAPAVSSQRSFWRFALSDARRELGRAWHARKLADPFRTCPEELEGAVETSAYKNPTRHSHSHSSMPRGSSKGELQVPGRHATSAAAHGDVAAVPVHAGMACADVAGDADVDLKSLASLEPADSSKRLSSTELLEHPAPASAGTGSKVGGAGSRPVGPGSGGGWGTDAAAAAAAAAELAEAGVHSVHSRLPPCAGVEQLDDGSSTSSSGSEDKEGAPTYAQRLKREGGKLRSRGHLAAALCKARQDVLLSVFATRPAVWSPVFNFLQEFIAMTIMATAALLLFEQGTLIAGDGGASWPPQAGLFVGLLNAAAVLSLGGGTGPAINPARDLMPRLAFHLLPIPGKGCSEWHYAWVPLLGGLAGGVAAGGLVAAISQLLHW